MTLLQLLDPKINCTSGGAIRLR